jgi:serine/threonine protein kinase
MAPEIFRKFSNCYAPACDVWALGVVMWEMICGEFPFCGVDEESTKEKVINDEPKWEKLTSRGASDNCVGLI